MVIEVEAQAVEECCSGRAAAVEVLHLSLVRDEVGVPPLVEARDRGDGDRVVGFVRGPYVSEGGVGDDDAIPACAIFSWAPPDGTLPVEADCVGEFTEDSSSCDGAPGFCAKDAKVALKVVGEGDELVVSHGDMLFLDAWERDVVVGVVGLEGFGGVVSFVVDEKGGVDVEVCAQGADVGWGLALHDDDSASIWA